jgi:hypothetical protein
MPETMTKKTVNVDLPPEPSTEVSQESIRLAATSNLQPEDTEIARRQLTRLQEYLTDCLALPNAEEAMLGTTAGCLMKVAFQLSDSIDAVLKEGFDNKRANESLIWGIEALIRVTRLIDRLTQFKSHLSNARNALKQLTDNRE